MIINIKSKKAFTLLEMSIVILIIGILIVGTINFQLTIDKKSKENITIDKIAVIEKAINEYILKNGKLPCPASINVDKNNSNYAKENRNVDTNECTGYAASFVNNGLIYGSVPTKTLGLTDDYAVDGWSNTISYVISKKYGDDKIYSAGNAKTIEIKNLNNEKITDNAIYVVISSGKNKNGAFRNGSQLSEPNSSLSDSQNAFSKNFSKTFKKDIQTDSFDDIVVFKDKDMIIMKENMQFITPCSLKDLSDFGADWTYDTYSGCNNGLCSQGKLIFAKNSCPNNKVSKNPSNTGLLRKPVRECLKYGKWSDVMYPCIDSCDESNINSITTNSLGTGELKSAINLNYLKRAKLGETITLECIGEKFGYIKLLCQSDGTWKHVDGDCYDKEYKNIVCQNSELSSNNKNFSFTDIDIAGTTKNKRTVHGECKSGYTKQGEIDISATCQADTTWVYNGLCSINTCQNSDLDVNMTFNITTETTNYNETQTGTCNLNGQSIVATCQLDGWHYSSDCLANALCDINDLRVDADNNNEDILVSSTSVGVVGSKFRQNFFKNTSTFDSNVSGTVHERRYFEDGAMFDATCYSGYTEVQSNEGPQITNNFRPHAYICQNGEWKRGGTCVLNSTVCQNSDLIYPNAIFSETTGITKHNNTQIGIDETGPYGPVIATCQTDGTWSYERVCDKYDLREGETNYITISEKSPGVHGSRFYNSFDDLIVNSSLYGGQIYDGRYFTNGMLIEANCDTNYTEITTGGQIEFNWGKHAYKCENGVWKRRGNCVPNCQNSSLSYANTTFNTTNGITVYGGIQEGSCSSIGRSGIVIAKCELDNENSNNETGVLNSKWSYSNCAPDCQNSDLIYSNATFSETTGLTKYNNIQIGIDESGIYGAIIATCQADGTWSYERVCDKYDLREGETNYITISEKSPGVPGSRFYKSFDNLVVNNSLYGGQIYDKRYFTNGMLIEADCDTNYTEITTGGQIEFKWGNHAYKCENGVWKRRGTCAPDCQNSDLIYSNATFSETTGTTKYNKTQTGTCNAGYSPSSGSNIVATCQLNGTWSYSGSCINENVCDKNDLSLVANSYLSQSNADSQPISGTLYADGALLDASCNSGYVESADNGDIQGTWKSHAYKCVNGQWKTMGSCSPVNCSSEQIIQEMENNHMVLECVNNSCWFVECNAGYSQVGNWVGYSCSNGNWVKNGSIQCKIDGNFCDINDIYAKLGETMNLTRNGTQYVINGSMHDNSSYTDGTMIDAYCNSPSQYDEMATGGEITNEWDKLLAFKCVNGEWKRMGSCVKKCENSTLSLANTYFVTAGTTSVNGTQPGTCNSGYSGTITATCQEDGSWTYSGSCAKEVTVTYTAINGTSGSTSKAFIEDTSITCGADAFGSDPASGVLKMCKIGNTIVAYEGDTFTVSSNPTATNKCIPYFMVSNVGSSNLANTNYSGYSSPTAEQTIYNNGSSFRGTNNDGSVISCNTGYAGSTDPTLICSNGTWTINNTCQQVCDSNNISLISGSQKINNNNNKIGVVSGTLFANGGVQNANCASGYWEVCNTNGNCNIPGTSNSWQHFYRCENGQWVTYGSCFQGCKGDPTTSSPYNKIESGYNTTPTVINGVNYYANGSVIDTDCNEGYIEICGNTCYASTSNGGGSRKWNTWLQCENSSWVQKGTCKTTSCSGNINVSKYIDGCSDCATASSYNCSFNINLNLQNGEIYKSNTIGTYKNISIQTNSCSDDTALCYIKVKCQDGDFQYVIDSFDKHNFDTGPGWEKSSHCDYNKSGNGVNAVCCNN